MVVMFTAEQLGFAGVQSYACSKKVKSLHQCSSTAVFMDSLPFTCLFYVEVKM